MKKGMKVFLFVLSVCFVSAVSAKPVCVDPKIPPGQAKKSAKVTILHCACADEGDLMQYVEIQVSSKSKGHRQHVAGSIDSCSDGSDSYRDFVRSGSDCQVNDGVELMDSLEFCPEDRMAMDECGTVVID